MSRSADSGACLWTDLFQFVLKMGVVIAVAWYGVSAAGGMHALLEKLDALHATSGPASSNITSFFPDFSRGFASESLWTIPVITFCVYLGVQWWAFWYPGSETGRRWLRCAADSQRAQ